MIFGPATKLTYEAVIARFDQLEVPCSDAVTPWVTIIDPVIFIDPVNCTDSVTAPVNISYKSDTKLADIKPPATI